MSSTQYTLPSLPASTLRFVGETGTVVTPSEGATVAIIGTADWGPLGTDSDGTVLYTSLAQWEDDYGTNVTPARIAVVGAFEGMGTSDGGGAGGVVFYRAATATAAAATKTINNTATTPAPALKLDAIYKGVRGNDVSYAIEADPNTAANDQLRIIFRGSTVETYSYPRTDVATLALLVNQRPSRFVRATSLVTGTGLALTAATALTGGNDGSTLTSAEFTAAQNTLAMRSFSVLAVAGLTDVAIKVQLAAWQTANENDQRPFRIVFGGAAGETVDQAITELTTNATLRNPQIIRFGVGTWREDLLGLDLSTAQLAPRLAGVLAARGEGKALTNAPLAGLKPVGSTGPTASDRRLARDQGITVLKAVAFDEADVAVSQGVTTFIDRSVASKPYVQFSEPRLLGILNRVQRYMASWGDQTIVGHTTVTDDTRAEVKAEILRVIGDLERAGLAEPGSVYATVEKTADPGMRGAIPYEFGFKDVPTANFLVGVGKLAAA